MPWPTLWSSSSDKKDEDGVLVESTSAAPNDVSERIVTAGVAKLPSSSTFTQPQTILATLVLTTSMLGVFKFYRTYLRRLPQATNIPTSYFRKRSILGKVTSVGDGDNFRIYHTPGGRLAGWGWLPVSARKIPVEKKDLKNKTIHVRIAGIDAPEAAHFGRPAQPFSSEALEWLTNYVLGRRVTAHVYKIDQYSRVVATVYVWRGLLRRDVGLQMLRAGFATVYEAKSGAEFGGDASERRYQSAEQWAKSKRKGMWSSSNQKNFESPREYKSRYGTGSSIP